MIARRSKKAVSWALRSIGKRNPALHAEALRCAERIADAAATAKDPGSRAARWVAADATRELTSPAVKARLARRASRDA